jgi:hypothetical protein
MNLAIVIIGAGALFLIANTMGRKEPVDDAYFVEDEEAYQASLEEPVEYWTFAPPPSPNVPTVPTGPDFDPEFYGE